RPPLPTCLAACAMTTKLPRRFVAITRVEGFETALGDRPHWHDAGAVHHDADPAEGAERFLKQALDGRRVGHVRLNGEGVAAGGPGLGRGRFGVATLAGIVQHDPEAVSTQ